jgi:hypothetical protein
VDIGEGALNYFFGLYKDILPSLPGYITERKTASIHFELLRVFLEKIASLESAVLNDRLAQLQKQIRARGGVFPPPSTLEEHPPNPAPPNPAVPAQKNTTPEAKGGGGGEGDEEEEEDILEEEDSKIIDNKYVSSSFSFFFGIS